MSVANPLPRLGEPVPAVGEGPRQVGCQRQRRRPAARLSAAARRPGPARLVGVPLLRLVGIARAVTTPAEGAAGEGAATSEATGGYRGRRGPVGRTPDLAPREGAARRARAGEVVRRRRRVPAPRGLKAGRATRYLRVSVGARRPPSAVGPAGPRRRPRRETVAWPEGQGPESYVAEKFQRLASEVGTAGERGRGRHRERVCGSETERQRVGAELEKGRKREDPNVRDQGFGGRRPNTFSESMYVFIGKRASR